MRVIWSLEKVEGRNWNQQAQFLKESVKAWDSIYPFDEKVLYVDEYSKESLGTLGIIKLFDEVNQVDYSKFPLIDSQVFWASVKMRVILEQREPFIMVDNDFTLKGDIKKFIDPEKVCFNYLETTIALYPSHINPSIRELKLPYRLSNYASNTSFLHIPDIDFGVEFANLSLSTMESFTANNITNTTFMLFAEQQLFCSILFGRKLDFQQLHRTIFISSANKWSDLEDSHGIFTLSEADEMYSHIGPGK